MPEFSLQGNCHRDALKPEGYVATKSPAHHRLPPPGGADLQ